MQPKKEISSRWNVSLLEQSSPLMAMGYGQSHNKPFCDNGIETWAFHDAGGAVVGSAPLMTSRVSQNDGMLCLSKYDRQVKMLGRK